MITMMEWHGVVARENPPCRELDRIALGLRAAMAIKAENAGLSRQRLAFLGNNDWSQPRETQGWIFHHDADGNVARMSWATHEWSADA